MRIGNSKIEEIFAVTDWCIKHTFPENYDARCLYTACAIHSILASQGIKSVIVGGDIGAFTLSTDGQKALLEGFGGGNMTNPSHYWIEVNGVILDPNVSYLPKRSRMRAVAMPMVAWSKNFPLPKFLQYVEKIRYSEDVEFAFPGDIANRMNEFIELCKKRYNSKIAKKRISTWLLCDPKRLHDAARSGDQWAQGAMRFQSMKSAPILP